jgi:hypothetical protein
MSKNQVIVVIYHVIIQCHISVLRYKEDENTNIHSSFKWLRLVIDVQ